MCKSLGFIPKYEKEKNDVGFLDLLNCDYAFSKDILLILLIVNYTLDRQLSEEMQFKRVLSFALPSQLLAWPADAPETVTVVTIAPDFHGIHHGYITNLKKFTAYFTSVLCFTTPGDGPPSTPQLVWTHEDSEYPSPVLKPILPGPIVKGCHVTPWNGSRGRRHTEVNKIT